MFFASDNSGPAHPQIMTHLNAANTGYALPYGADNSFDDVQKRIRSIFDAPDAVVYLVATGTAANALALSTYTQPWDTVYCTPCAHIHEDECNAPEFYTGGAKLTLVSGGDKMDADALRMAVGQTQKHGVHGPQRGPVSITQVTERGGVYTLEHLTALCAVAQEYKVPVHMDGARFANALAALGCTPAQMTWELGVDALSFGGTKNGCMGVEAVIFFDPAHAHAFELRRKRGGHLFSKHRFLSAQMAGYLHDSLWLELATRANQNAAYLAAGLQKKRAVIEHPVEANMVFCALPRSAHIRAREAGAMYYIIDDLETSSDDFLSCRLVCDWSITHEQIDAFVNLI